MEAIFSFFSEHYPTITLFIVGCVIGGFIVRYHIGIQTTRKKVDELPCDAHGKKLDDINISINKHTEKLEAHSEKLNNIRTALIEVCDALNRKKMIDPISVLHKFSPYRLTNAGKKFLEISGGKLCIDSNLDFFISELEKTNPQTAYDAETNSRHVLILNTDNPAFNGIKDYVFVSPETVTIDGDKIDVTLMMVIYAMSIYLRDKYFEIHPELLPEGLQREHVAATY